MVPDLILVYESLLLVAIAVIQVTTGTTVMRLFVIYCSYILVVSLGWAVWIHLIVPQKSNLLG